MTTVVRPQLLYRVERHGKNDRRVSWWVHGGDDPSSGSIVLAPSPDYDLLLSELIRLGGQQVQ